MMRRGETVWGEVETEIERRNAPGYDTAAGLLLDLKAIAEERRTIGDFDRRLQATRERHSRRGRLQALTPVPQSAPASSRRCDRGLLLLQALNFRALAGSHGRGDAPGSP